MSEFKYPRSVIASLKGDDLACLKYIMAYNSKTRRRRKRSKEIEKMVRAALKED